MSDTLIANIMGTGMTTFLYGWCHWNAFMQSDTTLLSFTVPLWSRHTHDIFSVSLAIRISICDLWTMKLLPRLSTVKKIPTHCFMTILLKVMEPSSQTTARAKCCWRLPDRAFWHLSCFHVYDGKSKLCNAFWFIGSCHAISMCLSQWQCKHILQGQLKTTHHLFFFLM